MSRSKNTLKVLTIGGATEDIFISYENSARINLHTHNQDMAFIMLQEGIKIPIDQLTYAYGGGAHNAAITFARLGYTTSIFCKIGSDKQGNAILKKLEHEGISTACVVTDKTEQTGTSFIIPCPSGDRVILVFRGATAHMKIQEIPAHLFDQNAQESCGPVNQLYITSLANESATILLPLVKQAHAHHIPVAINPGSSQLAVGAQILCQALAYIDTLILNSDEANRFMLSILHSQNSLEQHRATPETQITVSQESKIMPKLLHGPINYEEICFSLTQFFTTILAYGPRIVVVTNGNEGVYVATQDILYFHPSLPANIINTVGAGDAFGSCFVASLGLGKSIANAIRSGILNATSVIEELDAQTGILSAEELEKRLAKLDPQLLQQFPLT